MITSPNASKSSAESFTFGITGIHHIELLKYNNLAKPKYDAISADYTDFAAFPQHEKQMKAFAEKITDITGVKCIF